MGYDHLASINSSTLGERSAQPLVRLVAANVPALSESELRQELGAVSQTESKLAAYKAQVLAELSRRCDSAAAKRAAREVLRSSPSAAYHQVKDAQRLAELDKTSEAETATNKPCAAKLIQPNRRNDKRPFNAFAYL